MKNSIITKMLVALLVAAMSLGVMSCNKKESNNDDIKDTEEQADNENVDSANESDTSDDNVDASTEDSVDASIDASEESDDSEGDKSLGIMEDIESASFITMVDTTAYSISYGGIIDVNAAYAGDCSVYLLKIENKTSDELNMNPGHLDEKASIFTYGTLGDEDIYPCYDDFSEEMPDFYLTSPRIPAGETKYFGMMITIFDEDGYNVIVSKEDLNKHAVIYYDPCDANSTSLSECTLEIN